MFFTFFTWVKQAGLFVLSWLSASVFVGLNQRTVSAWESLPVSSAYGLSLTGDAHITC